MDWLRLLFEDKAEGGGEGTGAAAEGGEAGAAVADAPAGEFNLLAESFPDTDDVPKRFRGKKITESFDSYTNSQKKISQLTREIKELKTAKPADDGDPDAEAAATGRADRLSEAWHGSFDQFMKTGSIEDATMSMIVDNLNGMATADDVMDFNAWRKDRMEEYFKLGQEVLDGMDVKHQASELVAFYNREGGTYFSDEDEVMLNRLVKRRNPEAIRIIYKTLKDAGALEGQAAPKRPTPMQELRQGDASLTTGGAGFADNMEYREALTRAKIEQNTTGDQRPLQAVQKKLEQSSFIRG